MDNLLLHYNLVVLGISIVIILIDWAIINILASFHPKPSPLGTSLFGE
jgi:hypothetical protein